MSAQQAAQIRDMWGAGVSVKDMAKAVGIPRWQVSEAVEAMGLPLRWKNMADDAIDSPLGPIDADDINHETAQALWVAVLNQAVRDAVWWGNDRPRVGGGERWNVDWFDTRDAEIICDRAGFDIERLRPAVHDLRARFLALCEAGNRPRKINEMTRATR